MGAFSQVLMTSRAETCNGSESDLVLRVHNWKGEVTKETTILAAAVGASIVVLGSSIAIYVGVNPNMLIDGCDVGPLNQIIIWNVDSGTRTLLLAAALMQAILNGAQL